MLVCAALFTWGLGEGIWVYFQTIYLEELGANPVTIGSILGAAGFTMMLAHIPAGHLSDRLGRRPLLIAGWLIGVVSTALMALAKDLPFFVVGLLAYSFTAFVISPLNSYVTAARGSWSISRSLSTISATFGLGSILGPLTGGWIGDRFGLHSVFAVSAGIFALSTVPIFLIPAQPRDHHDPDAPPVRLLQNKRYVAFIALVFVITFSLFLPQPLTPNFLQGERGLSLSQIGLLGTVAVVGIAAITILFGTRFAPLTGMLLGQILTAGFCVLMWRTSGMLYFAVAYFILGGFRAARPMMAAQARELVHGSQMGLAYGMNETVGAGALMLAPLLAGVLYARQPDLVYPVSLGAIALSITLTVVIASPLRGAHARN